MFLLPACGGGSSGSSNSPDTVTPSAPDNNNSDVATVYTNAIYSVDVEEDVVYGQGLSHSSWNSADTTTMDLKLDIYQPDNDEINRPAIMFIHGGSFRIGDKQWNSYLELVHYFAARGFVTLSINYRVESDYGTIPNDIDITVDQFNEFTVDVKNQIKAMYPATRDAKAALRWLYANAEQYGINPDYISVAGGSAGAYISVALGVTDADSFTSEMTQSQDSTLTSTHLDQPSKVQAIIDFWGGEDTVELINIVYQTDHWDSTDAPISIIHGTEDTSVLYNEAEKLVERYQATGVPYELHRLEGAGHSAWNFVHQGKTLPELGFDFLTRTLDLTVAEN